MRYLDRSRGRRLRHLPLTDRLFARALMLGATSEHPTKRAVDDLWQLAAGDREALKRALARIDHPSGHPGHPGTVARALLRSAMELQQPRASAVAEEPAAG
jgi:hypothetical protein